jgi:hypothetical protein
MLYARSAIARDTDRAAQIEAQLESFCLFVGYPRSGSTLVGSILDAHPNVIIGHEVDALGMIRWGARAQTLCRALISSSEKFRDVGSQWQGYNYRVDSLWQGRYSELKVIGDKEAGRTSVHCVREPELLDRLRDQVRRPLKCIHVVRNPLDNIATMYWRGRYPYLGLPLSVAIRDYRVMCDGVAAARGKLSKDEFLDIYYDDVVADPRRSIIALCEFLELPADKPFVESCIGAVSAGSYNSRSSVEWSSGDERAVAEIMRDFETHRRFSQESV